jgi:hypothetical protein
MVSIPSVKMRKAARILQYSTTLTSLEMVVQQLVDQILVTARTMEPRKQHRHEPLTSRRPEKVGNHHRTGTALAERSPNLLMLEPSG